MLTDAAKATIAAAEKKRNGFLNGDTGRIFDSRLGARTIGDMALIEPGCIIFAHTNQTTEEVTRMRMDANEDARGGVVLEVTDTAEIDDLGTIERHRAFRCYWPYYAGRVAFTVLTEDNVNLEACEPPDVALIAKTVRRFAAELGKGKGPVTTFEGQLAADISRLTGVLHQTGAAA